MPTSLVTALAWNATETAAVFGVAAGLFIAVNGSPRWWHRFLASEPDPAVRVHRWRRRVQGYCGVAGATAGHSVAGGLFLLSHRPAAGLVGLDATGPSLLGMAAGLLLGLTAGAAAALSFRRAPEPHDADAY